jgi:hypothetical protein
MSITHIWQTPHSQYHINKSDNLTDYKTNDYATLL